MIRYFIAPTACVYQFWPPIYCAFWSELQEVFFVDRVPCHIERPRADVSWNGTSALDGHGGMALDGKPGTIFLRPSFRFLSFTRRRPLSPRQPGHGILHFRLPIFGWYSEQEERDWHGEGCRAWLAKLTSAVWGGNGVSNHFRMLPPRRFAACNHPSGLRLVTTPAAIASPLLNQEGSFCLPAAPLLR
jgi:hypothetical protein